jgi:peptide/nickel transport system permease protein
MFTEGRLGFTPVPMVLILSVLLWPKMSRLVWGQMLAIRTQEYVPAAKAIGVSNFKVMLRHALPNVVGIIVVEITLTVAPAIILEATISFLGLGIQPPTPSWGNLLEDSRATMREQWWPTWFPDLMIVITALYANFLGDALNPKAVQ